MPLWRESDNFYGNNGTLGSYDSWERLFLVDATPIEPQAVPWADYLEYTCRWAFGSSLATHVKREMTYGMHYSNRSSTARTRYDPMKPAYFYPVYIENGGMAECFYDLGNLTASLDTEFWTPLDCREFAEGLQLALNQHGVAAGAEYLKPIEGGFATNLLCPAGTDSTLIANYSMFLFGFHVTAKWSGLNLDASSSYHWSPWGVVTMNPAHDWGLPEYWQNWTGSEMLGLVFGRPVSLVPPVSLMMEVELEGPYDVSVPNVTYVP